MDSEGEEEGGMIWENGIETCIASVSSPLMGEYGVQGVSLSVPSVVGSSGVQMRIHEKWAEDEYRSFCDAVEKMRDVLNKL